MVSRLTSSTFSTLKFLQEKAQTLQAATLGIERLTSELREAIQINSLSPLSFRKVDPIAPFALNYDNDNTANPGDPDPSIDPNGWSDTYASDADGSNFLGTVIYTLSGEVLTRQASRAGNSLTSQVATNVNDFTVEQAPSLAGTPTGPHVFRVRLSLVEQRRVVNFESVVLVPGLEQR